MGKRKGKGSTSESAPATPAQAAQVPQRLPEQRTAAPIVPVSAQLSLPRPMRPDFGTKGQKIRLWVNMFGVQFDPDVVIHHYDVDISPAVTASAVKRSLFSAWVKQMATDQDKNMAKVSQLCVYDGQKNIFAPSTLGFKEEGKMFEVQIQGRADKPETFKVSLKLVKCLDLFALLHYFGIERRPELSVADIDYPRDRISALEVLLRHVPAMHYAAFGRGGGSFFTNTNTSPLQGGLNVHFGWSQSLRPGMGHLQKGATSPFATYKQLLLNMDVAATAFYESGPLTQVIAKFFGRQRIEECQDYFKNKQDMNDLTRYLKAVVVDITYRQGRTRYKIQYLSPDSAAQKKIRIEDPTPKTVTISDFFKQHYNVQLRYPWLPCAQLGSQRDNYVPLELLTVRANQRHIGKLGDRQVADMIKVTAVPPETRKQKIQQGIEALHGSKDAEFLKSWGVEVSSKMMECEGRILPAPQLTFGKQKTVPVRDGSWNFDKNHVFANGCQVASWGIAVFDHRVHMRDAASFASDMMKTLSMMGANVKMPSNAERLVVVQSRNEDPEKVLLRATDQVCREFGNTSKPDVILCILPGSGNSPVYNVIKNAAETKMGIMTQCCLSKHMRGDAKRLSAYYANIVLKINAKLGGVNAFLVPKEQLPPVGPNRVPTMIIGADVTHPPPNNPGNSIAAMVGSMDPRYYDYRSVIRLQAHRQEIMTTIADMVAELFNMFREINKCYPKRLLFYRDGVSEGQFGEVVYTEVNAMRKKFATMMKPEDIPQITFVVMNKRHHVRFFAQDHKDADRKRNLRAGTVIDKDIVHPFEFDFFLYSHPGLQGTSRPAHYHVLYDENKFTADTLQALTYRLCYLFCRSTRVVSMVPPAYYAHLLAARARCYVSGNQEIFSTGAKLHAIKSDIQRTMFFV